MRAKQIMFIAYHAPTNQALHGDEQRILIFKSAEERVKLHTRQSNPGFLMAQLESETSSSPNGCENTVIFKP